ncbi:MAG: hypothetical protein J3K34DRAFT_524891 [Monoraphidium minutum]|nr:MAG: hypothetical protein J3K34DRAFT_524891 [Monoraphidium minutum]
MPLQGRHPAPRDLRAIEWAAVGKIKIAAADDGAAAAELLELPAGRWRCVRHLELALAREGPPAGRAALMEQVERLCGGGLASLAAACPDGALAAAAALPAALACRLQELDLWSPPSDARALPAPEPDWFADDNIWMDIEGGDDDPPAPLAPAAPALARAAPLAFLTSLRRLRIRVDGGGGDFDAGAGAAALSDALPRLTALTRLAVRPVAGLRLLGCHQLRELAFEAPPEEQGARRLSFYEIQANQGMPWVVECLEGSEPLPALTILEVRGSRRVMLDNGVLRALVANAPGIQELSTDLYIDVPPESDPFWRAAGAGAGGGGGALPSLRALRAGVIQGNAAAVMPALEELGVREAPTGEIYNPSRPYRYFDEEPWCRGGHPALARLHCEAARLDVPSPALTRVPWAFPRLRQLSLAGAAWFRNTRRAYGRDRLAAELRPLLGLTALAWGPFAAPWRGGRVGAVDLGGALPVLASELGANLESLTIDGAELPAAASARRAALAALPRFARLARLRLVFTDVGGEARRGCGGGGGGEGEGELSAVGLHVEELLAPLQLPVPAAPLDARQGWAAAAAAGWPQLRVRLEFARAVWQGRLEWVECVALMARHRWVDIELLGA